MEGNNFEELACHQRRSLYHLDKLYFCLKISVPNGLFEKWHIGFAYSLKCKYLTTPTRKQWQMFSFLLLFIVLLKEFALASS